MIRKSEYIRKIDKYLNLEFFQSELVEFDPRIEVDSILSEEDNLQFEVGQSVCETDVIRLRENLNQIVQSQRESLFVEETVHFGLSEEFCSYQNLAGQLSVDIIDGYGHSFPKIHLYQHNIAGKENIHHLYKEQLDSNLLSDEGSFTAYEEEIFSDVRNSMDEVDVLDLRANIRQVFRSIPVHQYSLEDIDDYVLGEMDALIRAQFEEELSCNVNLSQDVQLVREIDLAWTETDILDLRASLAEIQKNERPKSSKIELIEGYLYDELSDEEISMFDASIISNPDLLTDVDLVKNIDLALKEFDVMQLRSNLQNLTGDITIESKRERSFATRIKARKLIVSSVAASLILLLGIAGVLTRHSSEGELYQKFYTSYQVTGINRSLNVTSGTLSIALQEFNEKDYVSALRLFHEVILQDSNNVVGHFYSGVSHQEMGDYRSAIAEYERVIKNRDNLFVEQSEWYIGLCYLQTNERRKAYDLFEQITESEGFYKQSAQEILHKMKYSED